jgi:metallo-beta-lactamase family protein
MKLQFLGAAGEVTGSCYLLTVGSHRVLLECGQIQGDEENFERNRDPLPIDTDKIDAVILSHAHIDHSGRLPLLVRQGYSGPIFTHKATCDLCDIMLRDSAYLHEKDALWENKKRARKGLSPIEPLYTQEHAEAVIGYMRGLEYDEIEEIVPGIRVRLRDAGHILGAAIVEVWISANNHERKLVFSGDLGYRDAPIMEDPTLIDEADVVLMESTYGNRNHRVFSDTLAELGDVLAQAEYDKGNIIIPAFAVGRTQDLLFLLAQHHHEWGVGRWQVFLDSPMAIQSTEVYSRYRHLFSAPLFEHGDDRPALENFAASRTSAESMAINRIESGAIVIAGSGMCTGGRVLHHLKHNVWKSRCHVIIVGFQAYGTLGRRLVEGADYIRLWNESIKVNAKIHTVGGLSAHADQSGLLDWYAGFSGQPPVWLVHGEPQAQAELAKVLRSKFDTRVHIPKLGDVLDLADGIRPGKR